MKKSICLILIAICLVLGILIILNMQKQIDNLANQNAILKSNIENQSKEISEMQIQLGVGNQTFSNLSKEIEIRNSELESKNKEIKNLNEELTLYETKLLNHDHLTPEQFKINMTYYFASQDFMPCAGPACGYDKIVVIGLEIENNAGVDLNGLYIPRADILKDNKTVGYFIPSFEIGKGCDGTSIDGIIDYINMTKGCKLTIQARTEFYNKNRDYSAMPDFVGSIKVKFRFINDKYYTDIYETNETIIGYTS